MVSGAGGGGIDGEGGHFPASIEGGVGDFDALDFIEEGEGAFAGEESATVDETPGGTRVFGGFGFA